MSIQITGSAIPPDGTVTAPKINSGAATVGFVLTADGVGGADFDELPAAGGGLLATGATTGATSQAQVFTNGVGVGTGPILSGTLAATAIARFCANEAITGHAHYGFLDTSIVNYAGVAVQGHASFNANVTFNGVQDSDHHHSYQDTSLYDGIGTISNASSFWSQPRINSGTITDLEGFHALDPQYTGGTIGTLYGLRIDSLSRGAVNYAIYTAGATPSLFMGPVSFGGSLTTGFKAYGGAGLFTYANVSGIQHQIADVSVADTWLGGLSGAEAFLISRTTQDVSIRRNLSVRTGGGVGGLYLGPAGYDAHVICGSTGNLEIAPRSGYSTIFTAGNIGIVTTVPTAALHLPASSTERASLRIPAGTAPTAPNAGDIWAEGAVLKFFNGTITKELAFV